MGELKTRLSLDRSERGLLVVESMQDVEPILEENKRKRALPQRSDFWREIGEVPNVILTRWLNEEWARGNKALRFLSKEFKQLVRRKLYDPDWAYLRTDQPGTKYVTVDKGALALAFDKPAPPPPALVT